MDKFEKFTKGTTFTLEKDGETEEFKLKPLTNRNLAKFMNIGTKFLSKEGLKVSEATVDEWMTLYELSKEGVRKAYPNLEEEKLDAFVSSNFFTIFKETIKLNSGGDIDLSEEQLKKAKKELNLSDKELEKVKKKIE